MATSKYKIGDKVRVTEEGLKYDSQYPKDQFEIEEIHHEGNHFRGKDNGYWIGEKHLEPIKKPTPKKVKVYNIKHSNQIVGQEKAKKHLRVAMKANLPVLIVGETGTGKTSIIRELAKEDGKKFVRIPITGETTPDDLVGSMQLENGSTSWVDGILVWALKQGHYVAIDEINMALPETLAVLQSLFDDDGKLVITQHEGESVRPQNGARVFATMNPVAEYAGTKELNKALVSRCIVLEMTYPEAEVEVQIIQQKCDIKESTARKIVDFGNVAREAKKADEIFYTCSTRDLLQWGHLTKHLTLKDSFEVSILNKAPEDKEKLVEFYKKLVGRYKEITDEGNELSVDFFASEVYSLKQQEKKLQDEKKTWDREIKATTERIRKEVIEGLVESSKKTMEA